MPRRYPVAFRRKVLDLIEAGKPVAEIAAQLGITAQTVYNWRNQDQIDRGLRVGVSTSESAELTAARKRIRELETELAVTRRANELLKARSDPKDAGRSSPGRERGPPDRSHLPRRGRVGVGVLHVAASQTLGAGGAPRDGCRGDPPSPRRVPPDLRCQARPRRVGAGPQDDCRSLHGRAGDAPPGPGWAARASEVPQDPEHADC